MRSSADGGSICRVPRDAVLLPLESGALLVSRELATFCRIPACEVRAVERELALGGVIESPSLRDALESHGFFGEPRPPKISHPRLKLQLTNRCNLNCRYCCTHSGLARANELELPRWKTLVSEACAFIPDNLHLGLLGGEPLLTDGVFELGQFAIAHGARLTLFTNGVRLAKPHIAERAAELAASGAEIRVSMAGASAATCDGLSGASRYQPTFQGIENMRRHGARVRVDLMLFPETAADIATHLASVRRRLPPGTKLTLNLAFRGGREAGRHVFPSRVELEEALDRIAFEAGERIPSSMSSPLAHRREACHCAFGRDLSVRSDGLLFSCFRMEEPLGPYTEGDLASVWTRQRCQPKLAALTSFCAGCPLVSLCGGGCRSDNLLASGDGDVPDCGPWRLRVLSELLAEGRVAALEWTAEHLRAEAERRSIPTTPRPTTQHRSLHLIS